MNWLLALGFALTTYPHIVHARGQNWLTSTGLVEDPEYPLPGSPINSGNAFTDLVMNPRLFDLTVSLHNFPNGDDDGNTQGTDPGSADQDKIEKIIQFMADGVYEATEGAHKLRQIRIFRDKAKHDIADIRWDPLGHPSANLNGIGDSGLHIYMYDVFKGGKGGGINHNLLTDLIGAGYTLAHEFGHYSYGLKDEYKLETGDVPVEPSLMNSQWRARSEVSQTLVNADWLQFSIKHQGNPPSPFQNTLKTAQHREYGESCWETLARANTLFEKISAFLTGSAPRVIYPELATVAPTGNNTPHVPDLPGSARSELDIIWMSNKTVSEIVIDKSGSMSSDNKISNARTAAKLLVDLTKIGSYVGVLSFSSSPFVVFPITEIVDQTSRNAIKAAIDTISEGGGTYVGAAAQAALNAITATGVPDGNRVVYLLTDGQSGDDSLAPIPAYQAAKIPIFAFSYGADADTTTLGTMASMTKGELYISPVTLAAITHAFQDANAAASGASNVASGSGTATLGTSQTVQVLVDSTLNTMAVTVTFSGNPSVLSAVLIDPGKISEPINPTQVTVSGGETLVFFSVVGPTPGEWLIQATGNTSQDIPFSFQVSGTQEGIGYILTGGTSDSLREIEYPDPFILRSSLVKDLPITGAVVDATVTAPDGSTTLISMTDDGIAPDNTAGDGEYTAAVNYSQSGVYQILVRARGLIGVTMQDAQTLEPAPGLDGNMVPFNPPAPVTENFERFARFQIETLGVVSDDHGNTPENATVLSAQNDVAIPGKIETYGDVDVFKIFIPVGMSQLAIRVSNLAFGMDPLLKIRDEFKIDVAEGTLDSSQSQSGLLSVVVQISVNETYFAEVSHRQNGTGYYQISAGDVSPQYDLPAPSPGPPSDSPNSKSGKKTTKPNTDPPNSKSGKETTKPKSTQLPSDPKSGKLRA